MLGPKGSEVSSRSGSIHRFSESQIVAILKEVELGAKVGETCRKQGVSEPTYYK